MLEREIRKRNANFGREPVIRRRPGRNPGPLSFAQQRLWFLSQLEPHSVAYNEPKTFRIEGPLDLKALQRALDEIVARHEVLRTTFAPGNGEPVQCVHPGGTVDLSLVDLRARGSARDREAQQILREAIRRPFDLSADLMLRAFLLRLADDEHILMLATHHVASDGWSMGILTRELGTLYESFATGRTTTLPELPIQYADYAWWQRQPAQAEIVDAQLEYWRRQLTGAPVLELPSDRPRTGPRTYESATQAIELPEDLCRQLKQLSRRGQATLYMTLLAALQLLLHRLQRAGRHRDRIADCRAHGGGSRRADRLLREYACPSHGSVWKPELPGAARPGQESGAWRLRAPGGAVRAPGCRIAPGAQSGTPSVLRRHVCVPEHARG